MKKIAVDFGTTNTIVAAWRETTQAPETIHLPGLGAPPGEAPVPLVPSLLYVLDGAGGNVVAGQAVREQGYDMQGDERFFSSLKRGIAARTRPLARLLDGVEWSEARAGAALLGSVLAAVAEHEGGPIDELVLSVPVESFEGYLKWLRDETAVAGGGLGTGVQRLRVVDESTAAALGYDVRSPGELVMVFDFGGGTLDVSLVRMPPAGEGSGVVIEPSLGASRHEGGTKRNHPGNAVEARVVAKAGRVLGGDDVDHWLLDDLLARNGINRHEVGEAYARLKLACEATKIRLSQHEQADIDIPDPETGRTFQASFSRSQLEEILDEHGFYGAIQKTINQVLRGARARGVFPEDIGAVLMIGGSSLIPSVRRMVRNQFGAERVYEHKPFEAVAHGALYLAAGLGLDDLLYHAYGVRHLSPITGRHAWEEIIPAGTRYPLDEPVRLTLAASREGQDALELVIGEVDESASAVAEVLFGERAILMVDGSVELRQIVALNDADGARTVARLEPPGRAGEDRVEVEFNVDPNRTLRVTVRDLLRDEIVLRDVPVVELR